MKICILYDIVLVLMCNIKLIISFFFFKQKTAYEMRISDWSSDVCSSDLLRGAASDRSDVARAEGVQDAEHDGLEVGVAVRNQNADVLQVECHGGHRRLPGFSSVDPGMSCRQPNSFGYLSAN